MSNQPAPAKRRGRPPTAKPDQGSMHIAVGDPLTADQATRLRAGLLAITGVAQLPSEQTETLIAEMVAKLPYSILTQRIVPEGMTHKRGPKPKLAIPNLLVDCVRAWEVATGERLKIWETQPGEKEALPCAIARVAIQVMHDGRVPYRGALHRAIKTARGTLEALQTAIL